LGRTHRFAPQKRFPAPVTRDTLQNEPARETSFAFGVLAMHIMLRSPRVLASFLILPLLAVASICGVRAADARVEPRVIAIKTAHSTLTLAVADDGRIYELGYGQIRERSAPRRAPAREDEFHPPAGNGYILEPALQAVHADGNTSTDLMFLDVESGANLSAATPSAGVVPANDPNVVTTRIKLRDPAYPFFVTLCFRAFQAEDVIEQWTEITHDESAPVVLSRFASSAPLVRAQSYWLTQFQGTYMREVELIEEQLTPGTKVLDSKIGVRAHQFRNPSFMLALDGPAREDTGEVIGGTLAWSGSFQFAFDIDWNNHLRALCGINPFGEEYRLARGKTFVTPAMLWTWSSAGKGQVSRNFHRWARNYGVRDGNKPRPVLLNNWEATDMKFDEQKIVSLFDGAKELGIDLFLLDDGWFGNKHPRDNDRTGLGDWQVNAKKLPHGLSFLAEAAHQRGFGFGIWLEPEMTNPASELFEQHPDWVIRQPKRELLFGRNQLVLDLTRPEVKAFEEKIIDDTLAPNPGIGYVKWDCNRYVTQPGSSNLPPDQQQHLLVDYQWALYDVMKHMADKYPSVMAMLCSGGSGRVDYAALRYFDSFWPSDNTDPVERIYIQWGFGHIFPANTIAAHVTDMGHRPLKLALDVALMGAFGIDRDVARWTPEERKQVAAAVKLYHERVRELVAQGDLYRLESPYGNPQSALSYVSTDRSRAVLFIFKLRESVTNPIKLRGLDPAKRYRVREINLPEGARSRLGMNNQVIDGATLMSDGVNSPLRRAFESAVVELAEEK
jgi:alpha-galactosidase